MRGGTSFGGRVCEKGNVEASQKPVVCRVLENVAGRHGGIAEAVNVQSLQLAFDEVESDRQAGQVLQVGCRASVLVDVGAEKVHGRVDEQRA